MHFPVYVVLPLSEEVPSRKDVERFVERVLAPYQYIERDLPGSDEPHVLQHGWWDWYQIGGSFEDSLPAPMTRSRGFRDLFRRTAANVGSVSGLLENWTSETAPTRLVMPDGTVFGGVVESEEEHVRWAEEARHLLERFREHVFVVVDCHK